MPDTSKHPPIRTPRLRTRLRAAPPTALSLKSSQRLDNNRLAEILSERGLVEPQALREATNFAAHGKIPMSEALVTANLVQDWELGRIVCEIYNLPWLPVELMDPDPKALEGIDPQFLMENCIVPVGRHGQVLTVCMPAMVPADVLGLLAATTDLVILPLVGSVRSNRTWLEKNLAGGQSQKMPAGQAASGEAAAGGKSGGGSPGPGEWGSLFDQADAAVLLDLQVPTSDGDGDGSVDAFGEILGEALKEVLPDAPVPKPAAKPAPSSTAKPAPAPTTKPAGNKPS